MSWLSTIFPQTVARMHSQYNNNIRIIYRGAKVFLFVNGSHQSGPYIEELWKRTMGYFNIDSLHGVKKILVLGVAGGTVIRMLSSMFPNAKIIGVDIDQVMIDAGKEYFGLSELANVTLTRSDAGRFLRSVKPGAYDLIVVDVFIGPDIPDAVQSRNFIRLLQVSLSRNGILLWNYLHERQYKKQSPVLLSMLEQTFADTQYYDIAVNRFFLCSQQKK